MRKSLIALGAILPLAVAAPSFAAKAHTAKLPRAKAKTTKLQKANTTKVSSAAGTTSGVYVGLGAGYGKMDTKLGNNKVKSNKLAGRIYGGYLFQLASLPGFQYGAETGFNKYSNNKYNDRATDKKLTVSGYNIDLLGVAKYNFNNGFNVLAKAGAAYTRESVDLHYTTGTPFANHITKSKHKVLPETAVGAGYNFNKNWGVNTTYAHVFGKKDDVASVNTVLVNAEYYF